MRIIFCVAILINLLLVSAKKGKGGNEEEEEEDKHKDVCDFSYGKKLDARGFADYFNKGKSSIGDTYQKGKDTMDVVYHQGKESAKLVSVLNEVLTDIAKVQLIKAKGGKLSSELVEVSKRDDTVEMLLTKIFSSLNKSGLLLPIIKMSMTNEKIRASLIDMTIDLIEADVIPYEEIFTALKDSGLAIEVVGFSLKDECTRKGLGKLIIEMIPELLASGALSPTDLLSLINKGRSKSIEVGPIGSNKTVNSLL